MRSIKFLVVASIVSTFIVGCSNNNRSNKLSYWETQCSNPWINYTDDTQHINNIMSYLLANGVNATNIELEMENDSAVVCLACTCPSGMRVDIWVEDEDVAEANSLGFN